MSAAVAVTDSSFQEEVLRSSLPLLVDFWASWCWPCPMIVPIVDELASEFAGGIKIASQASWPALATSGRFRVMSIPTLVAVWEGRPAVRVGGYQLKPALPEKREKILGPVS